MTFLRLFFALPYVHAVNILRERHAREQHRHEVAMHAASMGISLPPSNR
jgi:hypothetical protein